MADKIRLSHPRLPGREFWAAPSAVAGWQAKGWQPDRPSAPPAPKPPPVASTTEEGVTSE